VASPNIYGSPPRAGVAFYRHDLGLAGKSLGELHSALTQLADYQAREDVLRDPIAQAGHCLKRLRTLVDDGPAHAAKTHRDARALAGEL
jgi:hypothetical protein